MSIYRHKSYFLHEQISQKVFQSMESWIFRIRVANSSEAFLQKNKEVEAIGHIIRRSRTSKESGGTEDKEGVERCGGITLKTGYGCLVKIVNGTDQHKRSAHGVI